MAAVFAGGTDAVLSHRSAAALWGLLPSTSRLVEVTTPRATRSRKSLLRHCGSLPSDEKSRRSGIPVTGASRTLFDLASLGSQRDFERALREAEFLRLPETPTLAELLVRYPRRRGARMVRDMLERLARLPGGHSRSHLEGEFLRFAARAQLPMPETNVKLRIDRTVYRADCLWRESRLIVELDGHEAHGTRSAFESDRERDRRLQAAGWTVVRATHRQLTESATLATDIRVLLQRVVRDDAANERVGPA